MRTTERVGYDFYCDIAQRMVKGRACKGLKQEQLAEKAGVSLSRVAAMETVKVRFRPPDVEQIAKALDVSVDWLIQAEIDDQAGKCLYLVWNEQVPELKLYQPATSRRMAFFMMYKGMRKRRALDPLHRAGSIDIPIKGKGDTTVPLEYRIPDDGAVQAFQEAEDRIWLEQFHDALDAALNTLPDDLADILRRSYYIGQTKNQIADALGIGKATVVRHKKKALLSLSRRRELQQFVEERTPYYMRGDTRSGECTTELIVIRREELARGKL